MLGPAIGLQPWVWVISTGFESRSRVLVLGLDTVSGFYVKVLGPAFFSFLESYCLVFLHSVIANVKRMTFAQKQKKYQQSDEFQKYFIFLRNDTIYVIFLLLMRYAR